MVAIFTLFCIVFIDSGNKHKILNKMTWKLPVWASHFFSSSSLPPAKEWTSPPPFNIYPFVNITLETTMVILSGQSDPSVRG